MKVIKYKAVLLLTLLNNLYVINDVRIPKIAPNNTSLG